MVLIQLYVPVRMIFNNESILSEGRASKFKTAPIDPNDPFRGKYITLSFKENSVRATDAQDWNNEREIFVSLTDDENGYAKISTISKERPVDDRNYVNASINYVIPDTITWVSINYPFDRSMEESKANEAGIAYTEAARDTTQNMAGHD